MRPTPGWAALKSDSIKGTVLKNFLMTLLNVQYDLKMVLKIDKRTVSIKRTVEV